MGGGRFTNGEHGGSFRTSGAAGSAGTDLRGEPKSQMGLKIQTREDVIPLGADGGEAQGSRPPDGDFRREVAEAQGARRRVIQILVETEATTRILA